MAKKRLEQGMLRGSTGVTGKPVTAAGEQIRSLLLMRLERPVGESNTVLPGFQP